MTIADEIALKENIEYVESLIELWGTAAKDAAWQVERCTTLLKQLEKQRLDGQGE